ncbi:VRR-NUC domain-containing protein [Aliikangiella sp. IMCC44632]
MPVELAQGYYLDNFFEIIEHVYKHYSDLLNEQEQTFYHQFKSLPLSAQYLYVRMLTRKGEYFRADKLSYDEVTCAQAALASLKELNFIQKPQPTDFANLVALFTKQEWLNFLSNLPDFADKLAALRALKRAELDSFLVNLEKPQRIFSHILKPVIKLRHQDVFSTYKLLFFGNLHQDLTDFVLRDLALNCYENYSIDKQTRLFESREKIDSYLAYYQTLDLLNDKVLQSVPLLLDIYKLLPKNTHQDDTLKRRLERAYIKIARQLERLEALDQALLIYQECALEPATERTIRILAKQNKIKQALSYCQKTIAESMHESERDFAQGFAYRLARKHHIDWKKPKPYQPKVQVIQLSPSGMGVEIDTANYFNNQGGQCFYCENSLFPGLFTLCYWQVIYAPIKGAFTHPFQSRPHDFYDDNFFDKRSDFHGAVNTMMVDLKKYRRQLFNLLAQKQAIISPLFNPKLLAPELLDLALKIIPNQDWQLIFNRLKQDLKANRSGFPDLINFTPNGGYQLIEVKGPGDKLQKNQIRWMSYFKQHNIPHQVVNVEWLSENES